MPRATAELVASPGQIPLSELAKVPYLDSKVVGRRALHLLPMWDGDRWHVWVPEGRGSLRDLRPSDAIEVAYVASEPESPEDVIIPFVEFMWQRAGWHDLLPRIESMIADFFNLATAAAKIDHFFEARDVLGRGASSFVNTELEYIFVLARGIFDLLQETIALLWRDHVKLFDKKGQKKKRALPKSFATMVLNQEKPKSTKEMVTKYSLTPNLASAYANSIDTFIPIRRYRDSIVHGISPSEIIYPTELGWCVNPKSASFREFNVWSESDYYNDKVASLRPLLAHVIFATAGTCGLLVQELSKEVEFPSPIAPGYHVFIRGNHNKALLRLKEVLDGGSPWWSSGK